MIENVCDEKVLHRKFETEKGMERERRGTVWSGACYAYASVASLARISIRQCSAKRFGHNVSNVDNCTRRTKQKKNGRRREDAERATVTANKYRQRRRLASTSNRYSKAVQIQFRPENCWPLSLCSRVHDFVI